MPAKRICRCGKLIDIEEVMCPQCEDARHKVVKAYEKKRGSSHERGYDSRWKRYRLGFLSKNPLCTACLNEELVTPATIVDHITPHKGDAALFWNPLNHQGLCKRHHDIKTATEDGGFGNSIR